MKIEQLPFTQTIQGGRDNNKELDSKDVVNRVLRYKPGDDINGLCVDLGWAILEAQSLGLPTDFFEEVGAQFFVPMAKFVREYIQNPKPKSVDDYQFEVIVASYLRTVYEIIQYCKNDPGIIKEFEDLVTFAKSRLTLHGQGYVDWYLGRLSMVLEGRESGRKIIAKKNN